MSTVRTNREDILAAMRSALNGTDPEIFNRPLSGTDFPALSQSEKSALLQLQNWKQDETLRSEFPQHAEYSTRRLEHLINILG